MSAAVRNPVRAEPYVWLTGALLFGYLLMSRSFAHWGIRPFYVGEVALGAFLLGKPASVVQPLLDSLMRSSRLSAVGWWLAASLVYGLLECLWATFDPPVRLQMLEIFAFHLYPVYLFVGIWAGTHYQTFLPRLIPVLAWCHGVYGVLFITLLSPLGLTQLPEEPAVVGLFGHPQGSAILLLGMLAFERNIKRAAIPVMLNVIVMIGMQRRAEWIAFFCAVILWSYLSGRMKQVALYAALLASPLLIGLIPGVKFPVPLLRGEEMTTWDIVGRLVSVIDPSAAQEITPHAETYSATATWRSDFWGSIWDEVHATPSTSAFGLGYNYPLWQLHPDDLGDAPVRTPHSIFMFVLGYSGWLGVVIFAGLQLAIARLLWRAYRTTGEPFGICLWTLAIVWALFDPLFETPFAAIPLYLLMGLAAAPAFIAMKGKTD